MSKVATYIQGHVVGEVYTRSDVRDAYANDGGVLAKKPEMVIRPRTVNDIRKVLRFVTQLAEKGHPLSIAPCGNLSSTTASALGAQITLDVAHYLDKTYEYDTKQKLVHMQAGAQLKQVNHALALAGAKVYGTQVNSAGTLGGYVNEGSSNSLDSWYETTRDAITQLEIVLPSGDVVQTGRLTKREFEKKKGLQGAEGDLYRGIDAAIEDNAEAIEELREHPIDDMAGYPGIMDVKHPNGSFDLTPLLIGSQGSLAVVVEGIVKTEFVSKKGVCMVVGFRTNEVAHDVLDHLRETSPTTLEYYSASLVAEAKKDGRTYPWFDDLVQNISTCTSYAVVSWQDFNQRLVEKRVKRAEKKLANVNDIAVHVPEEGFSEELLDKFRAVATVAQQASNNMTNYAPAITDGFYIPVSQFENFNKTLADISESLRVELPLYGSALSNIYRVAPQLSLQKVGDKQKVLKLITKLMTSVESHKGVYHAKTGTGRLTSKFANDEWSEKRKQLYMDIKKVFDPHNILNNGVKSAIDTRTLVAMLKAENNIAQSRK